MFSLFLSFAVVGIPPRAPLPNLHNDIWAQGERHAQEMRQRGHAQGNGQFNGHAQASNPHYVPPPPPVADVDLLPEPTECPYLLSFPQRCE